MVPSGVFRIYVYKEWEIVTPSRGPPIDSLFVFFVSYTVPFFQGRPRSGAAIYNNAVRYRCSSRAYEVGGTVTNAGGGKVRISRSNKCGVASTGTHRCALQAISPHADEPPSQQFQLLSTNTKNPPFVNALSLESPRPE